MTAEPGPTLADLDEESILAGIFPVLQADSQYVLLGPGDDCATLAAPDGRFVVSTDLVVEGHDFMVATSSPGDVAGKVVGQNLADIAAMGAVPTGLVVGLVAPAATPLSWVRDFTEALAQRCADHGVVVVGGDLSGGPVLMVSVTVFGDLQGRDAVRRSGARVGDVVALAGTAGLAAAGLAALLAEGVRGDDLTPGDDDAIAEAIAVQRSSRPPLAAGPQAAGAGAHAMIDLSDGLLRDAGRVAAASGVSIELDPESPAVAALVARVRPVAEEIGETDPAATALTWVLAGGEDHGLLATFAADADLPEAFSVIGQVRPAGENRVSVLGLDVLPELGWDHYAR